MPALTRRTLLAGPAVAAIAGGTDPAAATTPPADKQAPAIYRYKIGSYQLTALYDGIWYRPITDKFIRNAPFSDVEHALDAAFMPHDKLATPFTALVVNTGSKLVLIDTGTGGQISPSAGECATISSPLGSIRTRSTPSSSPIFIPTTSTASRTRTTS